MVSTAVSDHDEDVTDMSEEAQHARQALQESLDLRDQGHTEQD